jgi:hypothetical protein
MAEPQPSKLVMRVRFPSPALMVPVQASVSPYPRPIATVALTVHDHALSEATDLQAVYAASGETSTST